MSGYSIETKNRFQLILSDDEDVDVFEILKREEDAKSDKKKKLKPKEESDLKSKNAKNNDEKSDKLKKSQPQDKADMSNAASKRTTDRERKFNKDNNSKPHKADTFEKTPSSRDAQNTGGFGGARRGSAGFRGGRGGGGRGGSRRYDRHSGSERTGIKSVEKKRGHGSHNWGGEVEAQLDSSAKPDSPVDGTTENADGVGEEAVASDTKEGAEGEGTPEPAEMTLDEWKASQASSRTRQQFNVRRAGEGEDQTQWKKTVALEPRKRTESTDNVDEADEDADKVEGTRSALNKLNIQIKFSSESNSYGGGSGRGGGGRGGSGRGGSGGRGRGRGFKPSRPPRSGGFSERHRRGDGLRKPDFSAPRMDNEFEFPSLGSSR